MVNNTEEIILESLSENRDAEIEFTQIINE